MVRRDEFGDDRPFRREFEGIQKYEPLSRNHPNLVSILHVGGVDDAFYCVMELADDRPASGTILRDYTPQTLRAELKEHGRLPIDRCFEIGRALASALAYLHQHGLVHRDVKPSNVIFVGGVAKLADIGLVAGVDESRSFVGTQGYIPPEGPGNPSADCYSLGKLLYELSTGRDRNAWPEPPADLATRPDRESLLELNAILHRACAPDPRQRYADASAMLRDLELLNAGKSVKRRRSIQRGLAWSWKAGIAACIFALTAIVVKNERQRRTIITQQNATSWEKAGTTNSAAWQAFERAMRMGGASYTAGGLSNSIPELEQAIALDPNYSRAWDLLSLTLTLAVTEGYLPGTNALPRAKFCAEKAGELSPNAPPFDSLAQCNLALDYDFAKAEPLFRKGIELNPGSWVARNNFAWELLYQGRFEEAQQLFKRIAQEQPQQGSSFVALGFVSCVAASQGEGLALFEQGIRLDPDRPRWRLLRGDVLWSLNQCDAAARDWLRQVELGGFPALDRQADGAALLRTLNESGLEAFLQRLIGLLEDRQNVGQFVSSFDLARLHACAGHHAKALVCLETAVDEHRGLLLSVKVNPAFKNLRDEPRFHAVLRRLKLEK